MSSRSNNSLVMKDNNNSSENGSSNGEVGGNNSDNSALVSLGNMSFGFNFDSEEGESGRNNSEGDSSDQDRRRSRGKRSGAHHHRKAGQSSSSSAAAGKSKGSQSSATSLVGDETRTSKKLQPTKPGQGTQGKTPAKSSSRSLTAGAAAAKISSSDSSSTRTNSISALSSNQSDAASEAVANLHSIARAAQDQAEKQGLKRKTPDIATSNAATCDNESSNGYNSDDEGKAGGASEEHHSSTRGGSEAGSSNRDASSHAETEDIDGSQKGSSRKKKKLGEMKREERNAREKERSFRISRQINELRNLLSSGGVIVPKGTKSSVLTEAANYIRMLQQHQYRSEIDRHQLVQQIQMIGGGSLGQQASTAVRHVAAQNGVWSLGNFGGVPPKSAMMYHQSGATGAETAPSEGVDGSSLPNKIEEGDYRHVFNSCTVAMAIASMGGAFIDCNKLFCELSNHSKQEICSMTVFNMTARQDLQPAFDLISQMLSAPADPNASSTACVLRGSFKHRNDLGLNVSLIKGEDGVAKCFCVTLIMNPTSPFDSSQPIPATIELLGSAQQVFSTDKDASAAGMDPSPAYTAG